MSVGIGVMKNDFKARLKARLYPMPYTDEIISTAEFDFFICRNSGMPGGKYAFAFKEITSRPLRDQFLEARANAQRLTKAMWFFREVGLYLVLCGSETLWEDQVNSFPANQTGLHNIIVQAVHFTDPQTQRSHLNKSSWGCLEFGGVGSISDIVEDELMKKRKGVSLRTKKGSA